MPNIRQTALLLLAIAVMVSRALKHPFFCASIALIVLVAMVIVLPRLFRWMMFTFAAVLLRLKAFVAKRRTSDILPYPQIVLLNHVKPSLAAKCKSQKVPSAGGRRGHLSMFPGRLAFTYKKWFGHRVWYLDSKQVRAAYYRRQFLVDILEIHFMTEEGKQKMVRFIFYKDRALLSERFATFCGVKPSVALTLRAVTT
jgi:hypothetical protein